MVKRSKEIVDRRPIKLKQRQLVSTNLKPILTIASLGIVLSGKLVINDRVLNNIVLIILIVLIALIAFIFFLIFLLILRLASLFIYIARQVARRIAYRVKLNSSPGSSFFLILLINVRINALYKGFGLGTSEPGLKALVCFNDVGFKMVLGVSKKVFSGTKHALTFGAY